MRTGTVAESHDLEKGIEETPLAHIYTRPAASFRPTGLRRLACVRGQDNFMTYGPQRNLVDHLTSSRGKKVSGT